MRTATTQCRIYEIDIDIHKARNASDLAHSAATLCQSLQLTIMLYFADKFKRELLRIRLEFL